MKWLIGIAVATLATQAYALDIRKPDGDDPGWACMRVVRPAIVFYEAGQGISDASRTAMEECIRRNVLWPYDKAELKRVGLYDQLASLN